MLSLLGRKLACAPVAARVGGTPTLLSASRFAAKKPSFVRFGGSDHGPRTDGITHAGLTLYPPKKAHVIEAKLWGALAWFWIFYQLEANWDVMLVRPCCFFLADISRRSMIAFFWFILICTFSPYLAPSTSPSRFRLRFGTFCTVLLFFRAFAHHGSTGATFR